MTNTPKLTNEDLKRIEKEADSLAATWISPYRRSSGDIVSDILSFVEEPLDEWHKIRNSNRIKELITIHFRDDRREISEQFKKRATDLYQYFEGSRPSASHRARHAFLNYKSYTEMAIMGMEFFQRHLKENRFVFSYDVYKQWLLTVRLGVETAPQYYVLGADGLNYPDMRHNPSPRLEALKSYLKEVYTWRKLIAIFDNEIHRWTGNSNGISVDNWGGIGGYRSEFHEVLLKHFDNATAQRLTQEIFAASPPAGSDPHQFYQEKAHELIVKELLPKEPDQPPTQDGFNRNYAQENEERERRERERREREERARQDIRDIPPTIPPNPNNQPNNAPERPERPKTPPHFSGFNNQELNDAINDMNNRGLGDSENDGADKPFTPSLGLGMPLNSIMKEDAEKLPWLGMAFNIDDGISARTIGGSGWLHRKPYWKIFDPATLSSLSHGEGNYITLLCELYTIDYNENLSNVLHNFFWLKNPDKKGYERLVKDAEPAKEGETETKLLITGKRSDDKRADKLDWTAWPFYHQRARKGAIAIGVPGVMQKSWRFTRWARTGDKGFDLDDENHLIGVLKKKGVIGGFHNLGRGRVAGWGSASKRSVLWITNQTKYPHKENADWSGDDVQTINSNNNFSHYLIFSNLSTDQINSFNCQTLAELVAKITKEGKGTMVRIGPDALNLLETQNPDQKGRSTDENSDSRDKNRKEPTDQELKDMGITREEFDLLNTAFLDPAHLANILKKIAASNNPQKVTEMLDRMFEHLMPKTRDNMFKQMVDHNPVFNGQEKQALKDLWEKAQTKEEQKKVWQLLTSHQAAREAHNKKTHSEKEKIFQEQVNQNPRYGPAGADTQERRERQEQYNNANSSTRSQMEQEENERFTTGENANQWGNYFQDNANHEAGAGDETVGTPSDNANVNSQFSFADSLTGIYKLKDILSQKPEGMEEGMKANKPYWEVVFHHPLTYIFLFIGLLMAVLASATRKNK